MRSATACCVACLTLTARAGGIVDFGPTDAYTFSQPVVQTQVGSFDTFLNEYLLDTGASGILVGASASQELTAAGLQTVATYVDFGVAGPQSTRVSAPYDFAYAGSDGAPLTLPGTRIQTSSGNFGFYSGIAGMPLMMNRTVALDLAAQADMNLIRMGVAFDPAPAPSTARQYSVPLTMFEFPMTGQEHPTDPLPVYAPLPFAPVKVQSGTTQRSGSFLLDTGAQQCILSSNAAFDLGLDKNGNGDLDDEAIDFIEVAGVGGSIFIPILAIDSLSLQAAGGVDLMFTGVTVGIIDIDPAISGVLGMNILNSGWEIHALNIAVGLDPGPPGVFNRVDFDFENAAVTLAGEMRLTVNDARFASAGWAVAAGSVLTVGSGVPETVAALANEGLVDLATSRLTVRSGLSAEQVVAWISAGRIDGTWSGTSGVTSSAAAGTADRAVGWLDNGDGSFTVAFAAAGDLDMNGFVDLDDVIAFVGGGLYDTGAPAVWAQGDYDYNGIVDLDDVIAFVGGGLYDTGPYNAGTPLGGLALTAAGEFSDAKLVAGGIVAVPEPAGIILAMTAAALAALWQRRKPALWRDSGTARSPSSA